MIEIGVIRETVHEEGKFVSTMFMRAKKGGGHRMIVNLSNLNDYIEDHHFKMDTPEVAVKVLSPGCYMASIGLSDAYYSVPTCMYEGHQKDQKFVLRNTLCQFMALPNGLTLVPENSQSYYSRHSNSRANVG